MNPMLREFLGAVLRWSLQGIFTSMVTKGILTPEQGEYMLIGLVGSLCTLFWILWVKYSQRLKILTALAAPKGTTERTLEQKIRIGDVPSVKTPKTESPSEHHR